MDLPMRAPLSKLHRSYVFACLTVLSVTLVAGCSLSSQSNCSSDDDCDDAQRCVASGGLLVRGGGVCVGEQVNGLDSGGDASDVEDSGEDRSDGGAGDAREERDTGARVDAEDASQQDVGADTDAGGQPPCAELVPLWGEGAQPATVTTLFSVQDCYSHEPLTGLDASAFVIAEDGTELPVQPVSRLIGERGHRVYIKLLLDMSGLAQNHIAELQAGAKAFVDRLLVDAQLDHVYIGIELFDGTAQTTPSQAPLRDATRLKASIDDISNASGLDTGATNLNGAVRQSVETLQNRLNKARVQNAGLMPTGYLVVFSAGQDSAMREDAAAVKDTIAAARTWEPSPTDLPTVQTLAVALEGAAYDATKLADLVGGVRWIHETSAADLAATLGQVADDVAARTEATYMFAYCSPSRTGQHTASVSLAGRDSNAASFEFNSDGFGAGCDADFFDTACDAAECGGFWCGGCDDEWQVCNTNTDACQDSCYATTNCDGQTITNPMGYEQSCDLGETITECSNQCVDTASSDQHCGRCANTCPTGIACGAGVCDCGGGQIGCGGTCIDPSSHRQHCSACFSPCAVSCSASQCTTIEFLGGGYNDTCVGLNSGEVFCWGDRYSQPPQSVSQFQSAVQVEAGLQFVCALLASGQLKCAGQNNRGQLGDGTNTNSTTPKTVLGVADPVVISSQRLHSCAVLPGGTIKCWGYNAYGQLGDGTTADQSTPVEVVGISSATDVAVGNLHTCAVVGAGSVKCWGYNDGGQLGDETTEPSTTPLTVAGVSTAVSVAAGGDHACALLSSGQIKCWGAGTRVGRSSYDHPSPAVLVEGITSATAITAGESHTCAHLNSGAVECWGAGYSGSLGGNTSSYEVLTPKEFVPKRW